jgi:hypothetical protein
MDRLKTSFNCSELVWIDNEGEEQPIITGDNFMDLIHRVDDLENTLHKLITLLLERKTL